jgi:uncharacterized protein
MPICRECCFRTDGTPLSKVVWEVTFLCPLRCPYCFQERTGHRDALNRSQLKAVRRKVCDFLEQIAPRQVLLSGGEPLVLGKELLEIIEHLRNHRIAFSLSTTGFPRKTFFKVLDYRPKSINISIDPEGMVGPQYEYRKTKFEILKSTLREIADRGIPIKGTSLVTRENLKNMPAYAEVLKRLKQEIPTLTTVFVTNPYHIGYTRPDLSVTSQEVSSFVSYVDDLRSLGLDLQFVNFSSISMPLEECPAASSLFGIVPNGDVMACPFLYQCSNSFAIGNVMTNTVEEIKKGLERFADVIAKNNDELLKRTPECVNCQLRDNCRGGCFAETFAMKETSIPALLCKRTIEHAKKRNATLVSWPLRIRANLALSHPKNRFRKSKLTKQLESNIARHVQNYMKNTFSDIAHRYDHIQCVVDLAKYIGRKEGANMRIVIPAVYFHDFAPRQHHAFHFHTDESADAAANFLINNGFDEDEITAIVHCIVASEFSSFLLGIEPKTLEAKVVRDADWLDAIGARGIARVFAFAGKHCDRIGSLGFNPKKPNFIYHNIMAPDETPMEHFAAKLLRINNLLLTKTGKELGRRRHEFMVEFLLEYLQEVEIES